MKDVNIILLDDDPHIPTVLRNTLKEGFTICATRTPDEFHAKLRGEPFDIALIDLDLGGSPLGLEVLLNLRKNGIELPALALSGSENFEWVRTALRNGAKDYILKTRIHDELEMAIQRNIDEEKLRVALNRSSNEVAKTHDQLTFLGQSVEAEQVRDKIFKFRNSSANILITGETGTGKEVVARLLRRRGSNGVWEPFVAVDSSTIQSSMAESILFGHERGAFTGADKKRVGLFEEADGGTVYFDELGNMPLEIQSKLLRVLQEKEILALGSTKIRKLEFRVVAATNKSIEQLSQATDFKFDLLQRLGVISIEIPPLRQRISDLPGLLQYFKSKLSNRDYEFSSQTIEYLMQYDWPGNVRELQNLIIYLESVTDETMIEVRHLPPTITRKISTIQKAHNESFPVGGNPGFPSPIRTCLESQESALIRDALLRAAGNVTAAADRLGLDRSNLYIKMRKYRISAQTFRPSYPNHAT